MCRSHGHCAVMGTASTMACMVESLGMSLPGNAAIPAADSRRKVLAQLSGLRIVQMVKDNQKPSDILTIKAFENAIKVNAAIGGSTNFIIHLLAIAGRVGVTLTLDDFDKHSKNIPLLVNLQPSGKYFMEDLFYAGGLQVVMKELGELLNRDVLTANGKSIEENFTNAKNHNPEIIATFDSPVNPSGALTVLTGNICEKGAVIKPSAASSHLLKHSGKAIVFENIEEYREKIDRDDLDVDENSILVLKHVGPKGYPGMPEVGNMGLPKKLLEKGVLDMVRISDGRMSGTGFGTVVLHVSPEAAIGGNFALLQTGDVITLDVEARSLNVDLSVAELEERRKKYKALISPFDRGYASLYVQHVLGADEGADFDFLRGKSGDEILKDSH